MSELIVDAPSNNGEVFSLKRRLSLYQKLFTQISNRIEKNIKRFEQKESEIFQLRKNFYKKFFELSIDKYNIEIFNEFKSKIEEFKIDLQISALNAKIKSLDMQEFSNIISVIGLSLQEESIKLTRRFDELKDIFREIIKNFNYIADEILMIKHVNINFSKSEKRLKNFIDNMCSQFEKLKDCDEKEIIDKIKEIFNILVSKLEEKLVYIYYLQHNKFSLNVRIFLRKLMISFRKIKFLLKDFLNFVFKINYLTLITKVEVGRIGEDKFVMVVMTLEKITNEASKINQQIIEIYEHYTKIYEKFSEIYSKFSIKLKKIMFNEYNEILSEIKEETEARMKFLRNELKKIEVINGR